MIYFLYRFVEGGPPYHPPLGPHLCCCCCLHLVDCCAIVSAPIAVPVAATATAAVAIAVNIAATAAVAVTIAAIAVAICHKPFAQPRRQHKEEGVCCFQMNKSYCSKEVKRGLLRTPN
jgi:hypothetical protein